MTPVFKPEIYRRIPLWPHNTGIFFISFHLHRIWLQILNWAAVNQCPGVNETTTGCVHNPCTESRSNVQKGRLSHSLYVTISYNYSLFACGTYNQPLTTWTTSLGWVKMWGACTICLQVTRKLVTTLLVAAEGAWFPSSWCWAYRSWSCVWWTAAMVRAMRCSHRLPATHPRANRGSPNLSRCHLSHLVMLLDCRDTLGFWIFNFWILLGGQSFEPSEESG